MKIKQILICDSSEITNTFFSFQTYVNEKLKKLYLDTQNVSDINIEYFSKDLIIISYYLLIDDEDTF